MINKDEMGIYSRLSKVALMLSIPLLLLCCVKKEKALCELYSKMASQPQAIPFLEDIKESPIDSMYEFLPWFIPLNEQLLKGSDIGKRVEELLISEGVEIDGIEKDEIILIGLKEYLNDREIDLGDLKQTLTIQKELLKKRDSLEIINRRLKLRSIIQKNDSLYQEGNEVIFFLPVEYDRFGREWSIFFSPVTNSVRNMFVDDTVCIRGFLVEKIYDRDFTGYLNLDQEDPFNLIFKIRVEQVSKANTNYFGKKLKQDSEIYLHLESLGNLINGCPLEKEKF